MVQITGFVSIGLGPGLVSTSPERSNNQIYERMKLRWVLDMKGESLIESVNVWSLERSMEYGSNAIL